MSSAPEIIRLQCANLHLELIPELGAAISAFYSLDELSDDKHNSLEKQGTATSCSQDNRHQQDGAFGTQDKLVSHHVRFDYLRPATAPAIAARQVSEMASFLMAPWAGRIRHGQFHYQGQKIVYPSADPHQPHSMHGFSRDQAWTVVERQEQLEQSSVLIEYRHLASQEWPFSFLLQQRYTLNAQGVLIELEVQNQGENMMPFGFGHHPFYPCDAQTIVQAEVGQAWIGDHEVMPIALQEHPVQAELAQGLRVKSAEHDTVFVDWQHWARIIWPASGRALKMTASKPQDFFVLYSPAQEDWFCAEPFANVTDSFNLRERFARRWIGGVDMASGERLTSWFRLSPESLSPDCA